MNRRGRRVPRPTTLRIRADASFHSHRFGGDARRGEPRRPNSGEHCGHHHEHDGLHEHGDRKRCLDGPTEKLTVDDVDQQK